MISGIYPGRIVPYTTRTRGGRFTARAKRYHESQKVLAQAMKLQAGRTVYDGPCGLAVVLHVWGNRGDLSNYVKAVEDAAQFAGIITNDRHVVEQGPHKLVKCAKGEQRVEWTLWAVADDDANA